MNDHCRRAAHVGLPATLTMEQWLCTLDFFGGLCAYYQLKPGVVLEQYIPVSLDGGTSVDNCIPSCYACHSKKGEKHPNEVELISKEALRRVESYLLSKRSGRTSESGLVAFM